MKTYMDMLRNAPSETPFASSSIHEAIYDDFVDMFEKNELDHSCKMTHLGGIVFNKDGPKTSLTGPAFINHRSIMWSFGDDYFAMASKFGNTGMWDIILETDIDMFNMTPDDVDLLLLLGAH